MAKFNMHDEFELLAIISAGPVDSSPMNYADMKAKTKLFDMGMIELVTRISREPGSDGSPPAVFTKVTYEITEHGRKTLKAMGVS